MASAYEDIIYLHRPSSLHPRMPRAQRAKLFAPFTPFSGFDAVVMEKTRTTVERIELGEDKQQEINWKLREACERQERVEIVYFVPDRKKVGGAYEKVMGVIARVEPEFGKLTMDSGKTVRLNDIVDVE